jgi:hypothetical protein
MDDQEDEERDALPDMMDLDGLATELNADD